MSSDTTKENASVVDSSLTEWKNDLGNLDGPEEQRHSSENKKVKPCNTRYFVIKSLNHQNLQLSIKKGIWATQVMNEPILEEAFHSSGKVILIFSVNASGFFQGYAQMMSSIGWRRDNVWSGTCGNNPWGRSFKVKWLRLHDLPFQKTLHLKNPLNHYKPVKISRDCQELPEDIGEVLCDLLDGKDDIDVSVKRGELSRDHLPSRRPFVEPSNSLPVQDFAPPLHLASSLYPPFYQHQADPSRFCIGQRRASGGNLGNIPMDRDASARFDAWGLSAERSPLTSTLTDDDILEMSYEEYLEAHSQMNKKIYQSAAGPSSKGQMSSSTSKANSGESEFGGSSKKRPRHRSPRR